MLLWKDLEGGLHRSKGWACLCPSLQLASCSRCDQVPHARGLNHVDLFSELLGAPGSPLRVGLLGTACSAWLVTLPLLTPASASVVNASQLTPDPQDPGHYLGPLGIQLASRC